jgi:hypothetical protein
MPKGALYVLPNRVTAALRAEVSTIMHGRKEYLEHQLSLGLPRGFLSWPLRHANTTHGVTIHVRCIIGTRCHVASVVSWDPG